MLNHFRSLLFATGLVLGLLPLPQNAFASWHEDIPAFSGDLRDIVVRDKLWPAPTYGFLGPEQETVSLADFQGRVVLLNFWATWCPPCVEEMPSLDRLQAKLGDEKFHVLALSLDRGGHDIILDFYQKHGLSSLSAYADGQNKAMTAFSVGVLPTTILVGPRGNIVATLAGPASWDSPAALELITYLKHHAPLPTD